MKFDEKIIAEKMIGHEPIMPIEISSKTDTNLIKCLNWYSYMSDEKDTDLWITSYMKKFDYDKKTISHVVSAPYNSTKKTTSFLCRMVANGTIFNGELLNCVSDRLNQLIELNSFVPVQPVPVNNVISIQDKIKNIAERHMIVLDEIIENWYRDKKAKIIFSMYDYIQKEQLNTQVCNHIKTMINRSYFQEFEEVIKGDDEQLNEAYAFLSKAQKKQIYEGLKSCIQDIDRFVGNIKSSKPRAPRKKKPISVEKQINSLKYQKEFSSLKIKSVNPQQIIGAQQLWVYNTKYSTLAVFNALNSSGFSIKGTTLQNYDETISIKKKIRKPKETLAKVLDGGKIVLKKLMSELTTKPIEVNGRFNDDTIFLRIIR